MATILDYLDWRGDLTMAQAPFNEVDNLILSELVYLNFSGIVPEPGEGDGVELHRAAKAFFAQVPEGEKVDMGVLLSEKLPIMLEKMAESPRFKDMKLNCYRESLDTENAHQFAAMTMELGDGRLFVAFRGTDESLAGWREDFYLACMPEVPAQKLAAEYLKQIADQYPRKRLLVGGHSKGGNLAVYASVCVPAAVQRRIQSVWSNDGPGFHREFFLRKEYIRVADRIITIIPEFSIVGVLLEHDGDYVIVESEQRGPMQHNGLSWQVMGGEFVHMKEMSQDTLRNDRVLKEWIEGIPMEQRKAFVNSMFDVLEASGALTLSDLKEEKFKAVEAMIRAMKDMDKPSRDAVALAIKILFHTGMKARLEEWQQEIEKIPWPQWGQGGNDKE